MMEKIPLLKDHPRIVFLVSDGQIYNTDEVLVYVK